MTHANAIKTHCKRGHPLDAANTYWTADGRRNCRTCNHDNRVRRRLTARAARAVPTLRGRLYARLMPCPDTDCECLLWTGYLNPKGYGLISIDNRNRLVHRVAWLLDNGPIPGDLPLDHVRAHGCRHKSCANVAHLEPVTCRENLMRGNTITAAAAAKTHCPQGHPYDEANTYRKPGGSRQCRTCHRESERTRKRRMRLQPHLDWLTAATADARAPRT